MLLLFGMSTIPAQVYSQSKEMVIGSVSGRIDAGEVYELYEKSIDTFRQYLRSRFTDRWKSLGQRDKRVTYSRSEIYDICLAEAKRQYGKNYPNLYLKDFHFSEEEEELEDEEYNSQNLSSTARYKKEERRNRIYEYSAIVVVKQ